VVNSSDGFISADGRFVVLVSESNNLVPNDVHLCDNPQRGMHNCSDIFVYDQESKAIEIASLSSNNTYGNDESLNPSISADGVWVVFESRATNLSNNNLSGVFLRNRTTRLTEFVMSATTPRISADGRWVIALQDESILSYDRLSDVIQQMDLAVYNSTNSP
jgi:Tol biopolymer transport system component